MNQEFNRPRLVRYDDVALVVAEFQKTGISQQGMYRHISEVGPVDLDLLSEVLRRVQRPA